MLIHFFFCNIFSLNLGRPLEKFSYSIHVKYCYGPLSEMYNRIVKCAKHHIPHFDKKASINNSHLLSQCLPDALLNVTSSPPLFLLIKIMWAVLVQITHKDSKRGLDPLMENLQTFGLWLQCSFVYKGFCLWRDWQLCLFDCGFSPCVIECWCKMASQEWSLCSLKDLLLNQLVEKLSVTLPSEKKQKKLSETTKYGQTGASPGAVLV